MKEKEYFKCYSWRLKRFIQAHGIYPVSSGVNQQTNKVYNLFVVTNELSGILKNWSTNKPENKK